MPAVQHKSSKHMSYEELLADERDEAEASESQDAQPSENKKDGRRKRGPARLHLEDDAEVRGAFAGEDFAQEYLLFLTLIINLFLNSICRMRVRWTYWRIRWRAASKPPQGPSARQWHGEFDVRWKEESCLSVRR